MAGNTVDWAYVNKNISLSYVFELRPNSSASSMWLYNVFVIVIASNILVRRWRWIYIAGEPNHTQQFGNNWRNCSNGRRGKILEIFENSIMLWKLVIKWLDLLGLRLLDIARERVIFRAWCYVSAISFRVEHWLLSHNKIFQSTRLATIRYLILRHLTEKIFW